MQPGTFKQFKQVELGLQTLALVSEKPFKCDLTQIIDHSCCDID